MLPEIASVAGRAETKARTSASPRGHSLRNMGSYPHSHGAAEEQGMVAGSCILLSSLRIAAFIQHSPSYKCPFWFQSSEILNSKCFFSQFDGCFTGRNNSQILQDFIRCHLYECILKSMKMISISLNFCFLFFHQSSYYFKLW